MDDNQSDKIWHHLQQTVPKQYFTGVKTAMVFKNYTQLISRQKATKKATIQK
jgi:hypothetical protein